MSYTIKPIGQRLIVKRISVDETKGRLLMPKSTQERSKIGLIVHCGDDCIFAKVGDKILFATYSGTILQPEEGFISRDDYEDCLIMNEEDIIGVLEKIPKEIPPPIPISTDSTLEATDSILKQEA